MYRCPAKFSGGDITPVCTKEKRKESVYDIFKQKILVVNNKVLSFNRHTVESGEPLRDQRAFICIVQGGVFLPYLDVISWQYSL